MTLRVLAEVDPSCVGGLISYAVTMLNAARENVSFEKVRSSRYFVSLYGYNFLAPVIRCYNVN